MDLIHIAALARKSMLSVKPCANVDWTLICVSIGLRQTGHRIVWSMIISYIVLDEGFALRSLKGSAMEI
jgi:hypothetical protein